MKSLYRMVILICFTYSFVSRGMQDENRALNKNVFIHNVLVGSLAGTAEVLVNQPTVFAKNTLQQNCEKIKAEGVFKVFKDIAKKSPSQFYRGLGVNTVCMVPTTAAQISIDEKLKEMFPGEGIVTKFGRNGATGILSASVCNASELIVVNQQALKINAWETNKQLFNENGLAVYTRGYSAKALRDGHFCAGFLTAYPILREYIKEKSGSSVLATILATLGVGPLTAALSHPFDTISTAMQGDSSKKSIKGFFHATKTIFEQGGWKAFFSGFMPRAVRVVIAIPLMSAVKNALK